jgi:ATP-dependent RNA helicase MRH4
MDNESETNHFTAGVDDFTSVTPPPPQNWSKGKAKGGSRGGRAQSDLPSDPFKLERDVLPHTESSIMANNVKKFSSVPLNINLIESLEQNLGPRVEPTDIQRLSLSHFFKRNPGQPNPAPIAQREPASSMTLLASQTGSGKSIAYLLPMLHAIKWSELKARDEGQTPYRSVWSPKGLILAPTHELARQLSRFSKGLCHNIKLKVFCLSQANQGNSATRFDNVELSHVPLEGNSGEFELHPEDGMMGQGMHRNQRPMDIIVGTTARVLDLARGRQWRDEIEKLMERNPWEKEAKGGDNPLGRSNPPGWKPTLDLSQVDWVVMDEADVVYGPDFIHSTELLLNDIAAAKAKLSFSRPGQGPPPVNSPFPFNLVLCTATIPNLLNHYITTHYPAMEQLTSVRLHQLPRSITPEHVPYSGGNRAADIAARLRAVWAEDAMKGQESKVLLFCNKSTKVEGLAQYLTEHGILATPLVRVLEKGTRTRNNDKAIQPFLKTTATSLEMRKSKNDQDPEDSDVSSDAQEEPRVLVTTSILSRGLDFNESVRHVFIVDEPRNLVDFIHRAGRTGRAGQKGKVVIFSKSSGRGSGRSKTGVRGEIMEKIGLRPTRMVRRPADAFAY